MGLLQVFIFFPFFKLSLIIETIVLDPISPFVLSTANLTISSIYFSLSFVVLFLGAIAWFDQ